MKTRSLIARYGEKVDPGILVGYEKAEEVLWVNTGDKKLIPVPIELPEPPDPHRIDNFGLPAKEQKFTPPVVPKKLRKLQKKFDTIDEIWDELDSHQDLYEEEIRFIKKQWYHRLKGYWFYNNGIPTYIDGWHYMYIAWWHIDIGLPKYRSRDRKFFLFARKIYTETKTFANLTEKGEAIPEKDGSYDMLDTLHRLFLGFNYPKYRREGATYKAELINFCVVTEKMAAWGGIQSMNETQARKCFLKHLVAPWKKLPFFFKPNYEGSTSPKSELSFSPPAKRLSSKGSLVSSEVGLESKVDFAPADEGAYDGDKLYFHHDDEVGKLSGGVDCYKRHNVVAQCLVMGSEIIGYTIKTSTVGEMERGGGKRFKKQCELSNYHIRNENGMTATGLATLFIPSRDGLEGFIDEYGNSVIDDPTPEQAKFIGRKIGAREYIKNRRRMLRQSGDSEGLNEYIRMYPESFAECFRTSSKDSGFNMQKLEEYIDNLQLDKSKTKRGNFEWRNNQKDTTVEFVERQDGKFIVALDLNMDEANRKWWSDDLQSWMPGNTSWGVAGGDPIKFKRTEGSRRSNGGGAVVRKGQIRDNDFSMKRRFACTYNFRPNDKYEYAEDMLKMCVYYGVQMNPEINVPLLWDYFEDRGYTGFLMFQFDRQKGEFKITPGANTNDKITQQIFSEYMNWIEHEADEEVILEVLEECHEIAGPEEMTHHDLFTAGGYALIGTNSLYDDIQKLNKETVDYSAFVKKRKYS